MDPHDLEAQADAKGLTGERRAAYLAAKGWTAPDPEPEADADADAKPSKPKPKPAKKK